ncbi:hypothetical protein L596_007245 [Steinernema carpocapsae]|uniref:Uncharacterized protein n=1 Tax=Steinernema carpocapsae TaxID=34508 RepID=A0A4U5P8N4_STECR|nr:hypothetical protein L596_007245 [Steinernema carpocapsae]
MGDFAEITAAVYEANSLEELHGIRRDILRCVRDLADLSKENVQKVRLMEEQKSVSDLQLVDQLNQTREETKLWKEGCDDRLVTLNDDREDLIKLLTLLNEERQVEMENLNASSKKIQTGLATIVNTAKNLQKSADKGPVKKLLEYVTEVHNCLQICETQQVEESTSMYSSGSSLRFSQSSKE